jgi:hypothetical protein
MIKIERKIYSRIKQTVIDLWEAYGLTSESFMATELKTQH